MTEYRSRLLANIEARRARVAIIGLGYVGLPLAVAYAEAGFTVYGIDVDENKVASINTGTSYIEDMPAERVRRLVVEERLTATSDFAVLRQCDAVSICVPTPLNKTGDPDISYIVNATEQSRATSIRGWLSCWKPPPIPVPRTEVMLPRLRKALPRLEVGEHFFLAFSPERIDPAAKTGRPATRPR